MDRGKRKKNKSECSPLRCFVRIRSSNVVQVLFFFLKKCCVCAAIELDGLCFVSSVSQLFCVLVLLGGKNRKIRVRCCGV